MCGDSAGAECSRRGSTRSQVVLGALLAALALTACGGSDDSAQARLADGSPARAPAARLEGVSHAIRTKARVGHGLRAAAQWVESCLEQRWGPRDVGAWVARTGVHARTVTVREASGRAVLGCDASDSADGHGPAWCGSAYGSLLRGALSDPRLEVLCRTEAGESLALAWIEPAPATRYVVVHEASHAEVYEVLENLPVRIATTWRIDLARSGATFVVSEHDARGAVVRRYELDTRVAG